jgi:hypothetical protein
MDSLSGLSSNPVLGIFDSNYWDVCYDSEGLKNILKHDRDVLDIDINEIITPVTRETVESFLESTS